MLTMFENSRCAVATPSLNSPRHSRLPITTSTGSFEAPSTAKTRVIPSLTAPTSPVTTMASTFSSEKNPRYLRRTTRLRPESSLIGPSTPKLRRPSGSPSAKLSLWPESVPWRCPILTSFAVDALSGAAHSGSARPDEPMEFDRGAPKGSAPKASSASAKTAAARPLRYVFLIGGIAIKYRDTVLRSSSWTVWAMTQVANAALGHASWVCPRRRMCAFGALAIGPRRGEATRLHRPDRRGGGAQVPGVSAGPHLREQAESR